MIDESTTSSAKLPENAVPGNVETPGKPPTATTTSTPTPVAANHSSTTDAAQDTSTTSHTQSVSNVGTNDSVQQGSLQTAEDNKTVPVKTESDLVTCPEDGIVLSSYLRKCKLSVLITRIDDLEVSILSGNIGNYYHFVNGPNPNLSDVKPLFV